MNVPQTPHNSLGKEHYNKHSYAVKVKFQERGGEQSLTDTKIQENGSEAKAKAKASNAPQNTENAHVRICSCGFEAKTSSENDIQNTSCVQNNGDESISLAGKPTPILPLSIRQLNETDQHTDEEYRVKQKRVAGNRNFHQDWHEIDAIPDTGATKSIISLDFVDEHRMAVDTERTVQILGCNGNEVACEGVLSIVASIREKENTTKLHKVNKQNVSNVIIECLVFWIEQFDTDQLA